ncbi:DAXX protein, partial [Turnix velox]|nr:DAXX protein [Turnix velox]
LLFQFLSVCTPLTEEHPEVVPFLSSRQQKTGGDFLSSAELRNVLSRCLRRVRSRPHKVYVYINELCTLLKAHTLRRKLPLLPVLSSSNISSPITSSSHHNAAHGGAGGAHGGGGAAGDGGGGAHGEGGGAHGDGGTHADGSQSGSAASHGADGGGDGSHGGSHAGGDGSAASQEASGGGGGGGSKRQIRYLENLLRVYTGEIRRLQERELDLAELDSEDSSYLQESRLKRRMMRIFQRLCQLKRCSSLTGRVLEQRIPYRGTRYPEVNRRIERFINRPEVFPDYSDILKVIQKASARHGLALAKRQMENMAQDAFREVGNRLQERRHLDLVYNFGSHLTDQYRPGEE